MYLAAVLTLWKKYRYHYHDSAACRCVDGESAGVRACFPLALSPAGIGRGTLPFFLPRHSCMRERLVSFPLVLHASSLQLCLISMVTMHAFSTIPKFRFQAVVYRVEIEKYVSLDSVQKRREADDNFKFTEYVVMEIIPLFSKF